MNKIKNIFKMGIKRKTISKRLVEVEFQGKTQPAVLLVPYGMFSNPAEDIPAGLLADQANEESLFALIMDIANQEDLEDGEIGFGIPAQKARIYFRDGGKITFKIEDTEGGDFAARFNELKSGFDTLKSDFNTFVTSVYNLHVHATAAPGPPVPPVLTGSSSSASIDAAKIEKIEFPS